MYTEILKLKEMLEKEGIPHDFELAYDGYELSYLKAESDRICCAIQCWFSVGHDDDLIEISGLILQKEHVREIGYLTAQDVFERIKNHYNEVNKT